MNDIPNNFDLVVIGTGLVESIVSAAASRVGKRVLHIDNDECYGDLWASFSLEAIEKFQRHESGATLEFDKELIAETEHCLPLGNDSYNIKDFTFTYHVPDKEEEATLEPTGQDPGEALESEDNQEVKTEGDSGDDQKVVEEKENKDDQVKPITITKESLMKESRKFNIDLMPKLQFARGNFVELLISSNIARYMEFRNLSRVLTWLNGHLEVVPCSRSDVFANNKVSIIEKRLLMKLLTSLDEIEKELENNKSNETKSFRAYLKERKLTPNLTHYVLYALSMGSDDTLCVEGIRNTKRFLNSLGRYGKTPFLFSMYGSGEISQAFCRLSAVFGGTYALNQSLNGLIFDDSNTFKSILWDNRRIDSPNLVIGMRKSPKIFIESLTREYISRAIFITNKSILESEQEHLTLLLYPPENGKNRITVMEMGCLTGTCPRGYYLVHMICKQGTNPKEDFQHCMTNLFGASAGGGDSENRSEDEGKPRVVWSCFFSVPYINPTNHSDLYLKNTYICNGPDIDLDYDLSVKEARDLFDTIYPGEEFLPRAPDPEEIVIEGYETEEKDESIVDITKTGQECGESFTAEEGKDEVTTKTIESGDEEK